jgi:hypothetical protein
MHEKYYQTCPIRRGPVGIGSSLFTEVYSFSEDYPIKVNDDIHKIHELLILGEKSAFRSDLLLILSGLIHGDRR